MLQFIGQLTVTDSSGMTLAIVGAFFGFLLGIVVAGMLRKWLTTGQAAFVVILSVLVGGVIGGLAS